MTERYNEGEKEASKSNSKRRESNPFVVPSHKTRGLLSGIAKGYINKRPECLGGKQNLSIGVLNEAEKSKNKTKEESSEGQKISVREMSLGVRTKKKISTAQNSLSR